MSDTPCPLCQNTKRMRRSKLLYGTPVCKKCYYKFANRRQLAFLIDYIIYYALTAWIFYTINTVFLITPTLSIITLLLGWIIFPFIFYMKDGYQGHSPGKAIANVQVIDPDTLKPIGFMSSFKRNLPIMIPFMSLFIAFSLTKGHRVGDGWSHSKVIWKKYAHHPVFTGQYACAVCQYNLSGNTSGICPECGTPITPPTAPLSNS